MTRPLARTCVVLGLAGAVLAIPPGSAMASAPSPSGTVVVSTTVVTDADGTLTTVYEKTYSNRGSVLRDSGITTNAAGDVVESNVTTATYALDGRFASSTQVYDADGDGAAPASTTISTASYDRTGFLTRLVNTVDEDSDGHVDSTDTVAYGRDRQARTFTTVLTVEGAFGAAVQTVEATVDARGNLVRSTVHYDDLDPSRTDYRSTFTGTYLNRQLFTSREVSETLDPDGTVVSTVVRETTATYDNRGNLLGVATLQDVDGVDSTYVVTQVYDSKDRIVHIESVSAGTAVPTFTVTTDLTHDAAGRVVLASTRVLQDGTLRRAYVDTATYDSKGRLLSYGTASDDDGDLATDRTTRTRYTYDPKGRLVEALTENHDGSGALASSVRQTLSYTRTTVTTTTESDIDGDGIVDRTEVSTRPA